MAAVYRWASPRWFGRRHWHALGWLAALVVCWVLVLESGPEGVYLGLPAVLPGRAPTSGPAGRGRRHRLTVIAVVGYAAQRGLTFSVWWWPVLGALVAIATVLGMRAVDRESGRRRCP